MRLKGAPQHKYGICLIADIIVWAVLLQKTNHLSDLRIQQGCGIKKKTLIINKGAAIFSYTCFIYLM